MDKNQHPIRDPKERTIRLHKCYHAGDQTHENDRHNHLQKRKVLNPAQSRPKSESSILVEDLRLVEEPRKQGDYPYLEEPEEDTKDKEKNELEQEFARQEENRDRWRNLHYVTLNQSFSKPWVSSYFKNIPLRIYSLPLGTLPQTKKKQLKRN